MTHTERTQKHESAADTAHGAHGADDHGHGGHGPDHHPHVLPYRTYFGVWGVLIVLTVLTVAVSRVDFGEANFVIAIVVATIKASLVALIFMHLLYDAKFNLVVFVSALVFFAIFIAFTKFDLERRGAGDPIRAARPADSTDPFAPPKAKPAETVGKPAHEHGSVPGAEHAAEKKVPEGGQAPQPGELPKGTNENPATGTPPASGAHGAPQNTVSPGATPATPGTPGSGPSVEKPHVPTSPSNGPSTGPGVPATK